MNTRSLERLHGLAFRHLSLKGNRPDIDREDLVSAGIIALLEEGHEEVTDDNFPIASAAMLREVRQHRDYVEFNTYLQGEAVEDIVESNLLKKLRGDEAEIAASLISSKFPASSTELLFYWLKNIPRERITSILDSWSDDLKNEITEARKRYKTLRVKKNGHYRTTGRKAGKEATQRYRRRRRLGLCPACGGIPVEGRVSCRKHLDVKNDVSMARDTKLIEAGLCRKCGKQSSREGRKTCQDCEDTRAKRAKEVRDERIKAGLCIQCGKEAAVEGTQLCSFHKEKQRTRQRVYKVKIRAARKARANKLKS